MGFRAAHAELEAEANSATVNMMCQRLRSFTFSILNRTAAIILCLLALSTPEVGATDGEFWSKDRQAHAGVSAALSSVGYVSGRHFGLSPWESLITSFGTVVFIGAAKEVFDRDMELEDLGADAIGALGGTFFLWTFDWE